MAGSIYIPRTAAVSDIIDTDDAIPQGPGADTTQFVVDLLGDPDRNKPLGEGFQNVYPSEIDFQGTKVKKFIDAEEYLKQQGYRHVYFAYDPGEVARDLTKENIALLKTQMAGVGIIDASKTVGLAPDGEFVKGIKTLMEFSMNGGGKVSWLGALAAIRSDYNARQSLITSNPKIETEQLDELLDSTLTKARSRKGGALSAEETQYIANRVASITRDFNTASANLTQGTPAEFGYTPARLEGSRIVDPVESFTPAIPAQEPDVEGLQDDIGGVLDEVFEGREELQQESEAAGQIGARAARTINSLTNLSRRAVSR